MEYYEKFKEISAPIRSKISDNIYPILTAFVGLICVSCMSGREYPNTTQLLDTSYDPCCAYPCQHDSICISNEDRTYECDCTGTGYHGYNCSTPSYSMWFKELATIDGRTANKLLTSESFLWTIVNNCPICQKILMRYIYLSRGDIIDNPTRYESTHSYITLNAFFDAEYFPRSLPPVPSNCPKPMGIYGKDELPPIDELVEKVFRRKEFKPEPHNTNMLFAFYAQHFSHQFLRTNFEKGPEFTFSKGGLDASNIYGLNRDTQGHIRSYVDGKLKTQIINGEEFPPYEKDVDGITSIYPKGLDLKDEEKFAFGHPFFALLPGLFMYSTIWIREHNRVCDVLKAEHPHWEDERLYHTAKLIILGETLKITIEDYVQHLSQYKVHLKFDPEVVHGTRFQFSNRIHAEFNHLYFWHPLMADGLNVNGTYYSLEDLMYRVDSIMEHGFDNFVKTLMATPCGALTSRNHRDITIKMVLKKLIRNERALRMQSINNYRRRFKMKPFTDFMDLTNDADLAKDMEELYGDIEAVEYYVGLITDRPTPSITPLTITDIGGPWSIKGIIANPICSPQWWKPSTFGGDVGFNIIKTASLQKLFCQNMKGPCGEINFRVHDDDASGNIEA